MGDFRLAPGILLRTWRTRRQDLQRRERILRLQPDTAATRFGPGAFVRSQVLRPAQKGFCTQAPDTGECTGSHWISRVPLAFELLCLGPDTRAIRRRL